jgi:hypothetical protein
MAGAAAALLGWLVGEHLQPVVGLAAQVALAAIAYGITLLILDRAGLRDWLRLLRHEAVPG